MKSTRINQWWNLTKIWEKCSEVLQRFACSVWNVRRRKPVHSQDIMVGSVTEFTASFMPKLGRRRQWPASRYSSLILNETVNSTLWIAKRAAIRTSLRRPPFLPSGSWLPIVTIGQRNVGIRLHDYWLIWYCTNFKAARNLGSWTTWSFCEMTAAEPSEGENISHSIATNWTRLSDIRE
jgi:hypothetical protein